MKKGLVLSLDGLASVGNRPEYFPCQHRRSSQKKVGLNPDDDVFYKVTATGNESQCKSSVIIKKARISAGPF